MIQLTDEEWEQNKIWLLKLAYRYELAATQTLNEESVKFNEERANEIKVFVTSKS